MQPLAIVQPSYLQIDPRTKLVALVVTGSVVVNAAVSIWGKLGLFLLLAALLLNAKQYTTGFKMLAYFALAQLLQYVVAPNLPGVLGVLAMTVVWVVGMYLPIYVCFLIIVKTTTVSEFVAAFTKMHVPVQIIIPLSVMFRFFPTIKEEWQDIRSAMKFRGIAVNAWQVVCHPMRSMEYLLVPLLMSASNIASELAAASLSRGLDSHNPRSSIATVRLAVQDYVIMAILMALFVYGLTASF